uniref:Uncharacterized protein n=1 Tax=Zooxanthella nutricula TaxID=1333877 RepID=A0A6U9FAX0_9DINO|mmetsp:Transcript_54441/g.165393  ORF Transcript_54441/g.165393 Transcript_54441/m.165393 type:complete len:335 (+) Transcript_54441:78-1082(+)
MRGARGAMEAALEEAQAEARELIGKRERSPWRPVPVCAAVVCPVALFVLVYYCGMAPLRHVQPNGAALLGLGLPLAVCAGISATARSRLRLAAPARVELTLAVCLWAALVAAALGAETNFRRHMMSYYRFQDLAAYVNVDPSADKGQTYMDAGQVYFKEDSRVATEQTITYRADALYCAAPIVSQSLVNQDGVDQEERDGPFNLPKSLTVDFWVIGQDCCDQGTRTFTCGAAQDPRARAGIRLLRDEVRPFYKLAVEQWTARLCPVDRAQAGPPICPEARHPLFFHWVRDPLLEVDTLRDMAMQTFSSHLVMFVCFDVLLALGLFWLLFKVGMK